MALFTATPAEALVLTTTLYKFQLVISTWYFATIGLSKLAVCVLYRKLFPQKSVLIILWVTAGIIIGNSVGSVVASLAACRPFEANWASAEVQADPNVCIVKSSLYIWSSIPNIITDFILLVLPLPIVWNLHASPRLKIGLSVTFLCGSM